MAKDATTTLHSIDLQITLADGTFVVGINPHTKSCFFPEESNRNKYPKYLTEGDLKILSSAIDQVVTIEKSIK